MQQNCFMYLLPGLRSHSVETSNFLLKCEHLLIVCAMFRCCQRLLQDLSRCEVTKFVYLSVYLIRIFLSVALTTAEVILKLSDYRLASCGRYRYFPRLQPLKSHSTYIGQQPGKVNYIRYNEECWTAKWSFQSRVISIVSMSMCMVL